MWLQEIMAKKQFVHFLSLCSGLYLNCLIVSKTSERSLLFLGTSRSFSFEQCEVRWSIPYLGSVYHTNSRERRLSQTTPTSSTAFFYNSDACTANGNAFEGSFVVGFVVGCQHLLDIFIHSHL